MRKKEVTQWAMICADAFEKLQLPPWKRRGKHDPFDKTSGLEAQPCPAFVCTRHEMGQLATYWYRVGLSISRFQLITRQQTEDEAREMRYADERIDEIWKHLGEAATVQIADRVAKELGWSDLVRPIRWRSHWRARLAQFFK